MGCFIIIFLPIIGIISYYYEIWWLFYISGGIILWHDVTDNLFEERRGVLACLRGNVQDVRNYISCIRNVVTSIGCWGIGYYLTGSFIKGVLLGACISIYAQWVSLAIVSVFMLLFSIFKR